MAPKNIKRRGARTRVPITRQLRPTQGDGPSYRGQAITVLDIPGDTFNIATNGAGTISSVYVLSSTAISSNFQSNWGSAFQEYRIRSVHYDFVGCNPTATGATLVRFDEKNSGAPSLADMEQSASRLVSNFAGNKSSSWSMNWIARDIVDLPFLPISTATPVAYLKFYTNTAQLISPASSDLFIGRPIMRVEFRGVGFN